MLSVLQEEKVLETCFTTVLSILSTIELSTAPYIYRILLFALFITIPLLKSSISSEHILKCKCTSTMSKDGEKHTSLD